MITVQIKWDLSEASSKCLIKVSSHYCHVLRATGVPQAMLPAPSHPSPGKQTGQRQMFTGLLYFNMSGFIESYGGKCIFLKPIITCSIDRKDVNKNDLLSHRNINNSFVEEQKL